MMFCLKYNLCCLKCHLVLKFSSSDCVNSELVWSWYQLYECIWLLSFEVWSVSVTCFCSDVPRFQPSRWDMEGRGNRIKCEVLFDTKPVLFCLKLQWDFLLYVLDVGFPVNFLIYYHPKKFNLTHRWFRREARDRFIHYKILHHYYFTAVHLHKMCLLENSLCFFFCISPYLC